MAEEKKKKHKKKHRFFWFMIKLQIFLMLLVLGGLGYYFYGGYAEQVQELRSDAIALVDASDANTFVPGRTSSLYDKDGNLISELSGEKDAEYVKYEDIPAYFVTAMVSIEDKKFYSHDGVDYKALIRAAKSIIQEHRISQGGSTITMQLARNIYLDTGKTWQRKVEEMFIAMELEKRYSKNQLMEYYLNNIYFANGYYGIDAACHGYFDCELSELSLSQIAFLCAIPNSPTYYDPLVNPENTMKRRDLILKNMYEDSKIDVATYQTAIDEAINLNVPQEEENLKNNSVDTYAYYCATRALMENGGFEIKYYFDSDEEEEAYKEEYNELYDYYQKKLYSGGYKIYTSIDMSLQDQLQQAVDETLADFDSVNDEGVYEMQGAAVSIDNDTGMVVAIVGSRDQNFAGYTLNRAYQSHRQPGSSIKPLIVYTPSFERGYTPDSEMVDKKIDDGPSNSSGNYLGKITLKTAVAKSINTIAWQLYEELTPEVGLSYLKNMNFSNIVDSDYVMATALGGFTTGVSPLEMASAYATIENDGLYREPTCITQIIDDDENIIYYNNQIETVIYSETASRMMVECMEEVMNSGTAKKIKLDDMPCAGKTGTTNDQKDGWFCGFTRYYTTAVWVGYDIPKTVSDLKGNTYPAQIWYQYMSKIHEGKTPIEFLPYAKLSEEFNEQQNQDNNQSSDINSDDNNDEDDADNDDDGADDNGDNDDNGNSNDDANTDDADNDTDADGIDNNQDNTDSDNNVENDIGGLDD